MSKGRILVVEDEPDIANMLKIYFTGQGYDIEIASRGGDASKMVQQQLPQLMVLDINLPDIDGYTLCKQMRTNTRTRHIPIIFLTEKDERGDRIAGLELGADDYITKPFDIEELRLRIANAIRASERMGLTDPRSGLPSGRLIEDALRELIRKPKWAYFDIRIADFDPFRDKYGFVAGDEVLRFTAMLISEIISEHGSPDDFIGHPGNDNFVLISHPEKKDEIKDLLETRFNEGVKSHYSFIDREQGGITLEDVGVERKVPIMTISIGAVTSEREFSDIREITEAAAEERRRIYGSGSFSRAAIQAALSAAQNAAPPPPPAAPQSAPTNAPPVTPPPAAPVASPPVPPAGSPPAAPKPVVADPDETIQHPAVKPGQTAPTEPPKQGSSASHSAPTVKAPKITRSDGSSSSEGASGKT
jgi:CheY-like chemotaxis protein